MASVFRASYRSLSLLATLNWDRLLYAATIALALIGGSYVGNHFL